MESFKSQRKTSKMLLTCFYLFALTFYRIQATFTAEDYVKERLITKNETFNWLKNLESRNGTSPYCDLCCVKISKSIVGKMCGRHTMCIFPNNTIGPSCRGYINVHFSNEEKTALLDIHNSLRNKVAAGMEQDGRPGPQPSASNMRIMEWNNELSDIAQRWVAQCIFSHDLCRDTITFPVGQNLGRGNLATDNELSLVVRWYDEVKDFDKDEVPSFKFVQTNDHSSGRYTQLVWADSNMLGCARGIFQQFTGARLSYVEHLVCNYGPTGNIPDQPVYRIGPPCSTCPEGMVCSLEYNGLCEAGEKVSLGVDVRNAAFKLKLSDFFPLMYALMLK